MGDEWEVDEAQRRFNDVFEAALAGRPQVVRRRDGKEVVVVPRERFEEARPDLETCLLTAGYAEEGEDEFDEILRQIRF